MSTQQIIDALFAAIDSNQPMHELMRENETKAGATVILPGDVSWLPATDWHPTVTVSRRGDEIRLIAVIATNPGRGAFRRTVAGIIEAGLTPVIVVPTNEMRATMRRWNWYPRTVGSGLTSEEQWRPRKGWRPAPPTAPNQKG